MLSIFKLREGKKKNIVTLAIDLFLSCHPASSRDDLCEQFSAVSTEKVGKKESPYGQFQKAMRKIKWTVKSPLKVLIKEVKCIM